MLWEIIDRYWLWGRAELVFLIAWALVLGLGILAAWWIGWRARNHLIGAGVAGAVGALWTLVWDRMRERWVRPRAE